MFTSPIAFANLELTLALATADTKDTSLTTVKAAVDPSTTSQCNLMNHLFTLDPTDESLATYNFKTQR